MNYSTAVMLINDNITVVNTSYDKDCDGSGREFKRYKTLDKTLKVGDLVSVPTNTRHGFTIVRVEELDVEVDFESHVKIDWIASKIDNAPYDKILKEEQEWISVIKASEKRKKREDIKKNLLDMHADEGIEKLAIATLGSESSLEDKSSKDEG